MGVYWGSGELAMRLEAVRHCGGVPQGACGCILEPPYLSSREGFWGGGEAELCLCPCHLDRVGSLEEHLYP